MISPKTQSREKNVVEYFREHLRSGDYHSEGQFTYGAWFKSAGGELGLNGEVVDFDFHADAELMTALARKPETFADFNCHMVAAGWIRAQKSPSVRTGCSWTDGLVEYGGRWCQPLVV